MRWLTGTWGWGWTTAAVDWRWEKSRRWCLVSWASFIVARMHGVGSPDDSDIFVRAFAGSLCITCHGNEMKYIYIFGGIQLPGNWMTPSLWRVRLPCLIGPSKGTDDELSPYHKAIRPMKPRPRHIRALESDSSIWRPLYTITNSLHPGLRPIFERPGTEPNGRRPYRILQEIMRRVKDRLWGQSRLLVPWGILLINHSFVMWK